MNSNRTGFLHTTIVFCGCSLLWVLPNAGCHSNSGGTIPDAGLAPTADAALIDAPEIEAGGCPATCEDGNPCTTDTCDPVSQQCVHVALSDGTPCEDGNLCTVNDFCHGGLCYSDPVFKTCQASDQCHKAGVCDPKTGQCTNPTANNGTACTDGKYCTAGDHCAAGTCVGTALPCPSGYACDEVTVLCVGQGVDGGTGYFFPAATSAKAYENLYWQASGNPMVSTNDGKVFVGGSFAGTVDLGTGPMDSGDAYEQDVFLAELDATTGTTLWSQSYSGPLNQAVNAVAANGAGQLGLAGHLAGILTVGPDEIEAATAEDRFVMGASTTQGAGLWARRLNLRTKPSGRGELSSMAGDPNQSAFVVCGNTDKGATDLAPGLVNQGGVDFFVARLDGQTGRTLWAQQLGGVNDEDCSAVAVDAQSNIYVVGTYMYGSTVTVPGLTLPLDFVDTTNGTKWLFIAKLDPTGQGLWAYTIGTPGKSDSFRATAIWPVSDGLVVAGSSTANVDSPSLSLKADSRFFVAKFASDVGSQVGHVVWAVPLATGQGDAADSVSAFSSNSQGALILAGSYKQSLTLGGSPLPLASTSPGGFVAQMDGASGRFLIARGYASPVESNLVLGVATNALTLGQGKDSTLLLGQFRKQIDLGAPLGALTSSTSSNVGAVPSTFVTRLVP